MFRGTPPLFKSGGRGVSAKYLDALTVLKTSLSLKTYTTFFPSHSRPTLVPLGMQYTVCLFLDLLTYLLHGAESFLRN
jgi:hypothetical protein